jgi:EF hand
MRRLGIAFIGVMAAAGCTSRDTVVREAPVPKYDANAIAAASMSEFDKNKDGSLDWSELKYCPALLGAFADIDTNRDKKISESELRKRIEEYSASPTGSIPVSCLVSLDGRPLADATVNFEPEPCMGGTVKLATGKTDNSGGCVEYEIDGKVHRGLAPGLYRIRVTKDGVAIPARFNSQTTLGKEVFHNPRAAEVNVELELASR